MRTMTAEKKAVKTNGAGDGAGNVAMRESILEAAEELFVERGFDGVSVNDVAARAGGSKALVFYHFKNKQVLFEKVLERYYVEQASTLMSAFDAGASVVEKIHAGVDAYLDFLEKRPGHPRLIMGEICSNSDNLEKILDHMKPLNNWGKAVFGDNLPAGGPFSHKHFFISIFGVIISYYTYAPILERLWGDDLMTAPALSERRVHLHALIDAMIGKEKNLKA